MAQTTTLGEQRGRPRGEPFGKASRKAGSTRRQKEVDKETPSRRTMSDADISLLVNLRLYMFMLSI